MSIWTVIPLCFLVFFNAGFYLGLRLGGKIKEDALKKYFQEQFPYDVKKWASELDE